MTRNRIHKRISDGKILLSPEIRKEIKIIFRGETRHIIRRIADGDENYRLRKSKLYAKSDNDDIKYVYLIVIYTKVLVNFTQNFTIN
jgi:hypothetical protein